MLPIKKIIAESTPVRTITPNDFSRVRPLQEVVLGALMLDSRAIDIVLEVLKAPAFFYGDDHQLIYEAIIDLHRRYQPVDLLTVTERLHKKNQIKKIGGPVYLTKLTNRVASAANIEYHSRIVAQYYMKRLVWEMSQNSINAAAHPQADSFDVFGYICDEVRKLEENLLGKSGNTMQDLAYQSLAKIEEARQQQCGITGVPTGFTEFDAITAGCQPTDLIILAARPSIGKTSMACKLAKNCAKLFDVPVGLFLLEMSSLQGFNRMVSQESNIPNKQILTGELEGMDMDIYTQTINSLSGLPIYFDDTTSINLMELRAKAKKWVLLHGVKIIIIDYLQLLAGWPNKKYGNAEARVADISRALKALAKELNIPVIALSQLSRAVESRNDKRPTLADLRQSGAIEQDADIVTFLYRDEYYKIFEDENGNSTKGKAEWIIAKHRNGELGKVYLKFEPSTTDFYDYHHNDWDDTIPMPSNMPPTILLRGEPSADDW